VAIAGSWRLLRKHGYRDLLLANLSSDTGAYLQTVGGVADGFI
jgi:hypothetical protein